MRHPDFDIEILINNLRGTCNSMEQVMDDLYPEMDWMVDATKEELEGLDSEIFQCEECGWWCEQHEMCDDNSGDWVCRDCRPGDEE